MDIGVKPQVVQSARIQKGLLMRQILVLAAAFSAIVFTVRPAEAFHHHAHNQSGAPVAAGPYAPQAAAPLSPALIYQIVSSGFQFLQDVRNNRSGQDNQTTKRQIVDSEVSTRINKVDADLDTLVTRTNAIADQNKGLYSKVKRVTNTTSTTSGGSSGTDSRPPAVTDGSPPPG
jgi:hypothetical protein